MQIYCAKVDMLILPLDYVAKARNRSAWVKRASRTVIVKVQLAETLLSANAVGVVMDQKFAQHYPVTHLLFKQDKHLKTITTQQNDVI